MKAFCQISLLVLIIPLINSACDISDPEITEGYIDSAIELQIKEHLSPEKRELFLYAKTEKIYPCINFFLIYDKYLLENALSIVFRKVDISNLCFTATGPATARIPLDLNDGVHNFSFNVHNSEIFGTLKIDGESIKFDIPWQDDFKIPQPVLMRVPDNTYWGEIRKLDSASEKRFDEYFSKMKAVGAEFRKFKPGNYNYFQIDENGNIVQNNDSVIPYYSNKSNFIFSYPGEYNELINYFDSIGTKFTDHHIKLNTFRGEYFSNY